MLSSCNTWLLPYVFYNCLIILAFITIWEDKYYKSWWPTSYQLKEQRLNDSLSCSFVSVAITEDLLAEEF